MTKLIIALSSALPVALFLVSCGERNPPMTAKDDIKKNFYLGVESSLELDTLQNQMGDAPTAYLKSFAGDTIPWQRWNKDLLDKANRAQVPVFAYVGSPVRISSRRVAREIDQSAQMRRMVSEKAICTAIDTRIHPEIGQLAYHLAVESESSFSLPMAIWLSPEGSPIGSISIGYATGRELENIIQKVHAMLSESWENSSRFVIENSREINGLRQERFDFESGPEPTEGRREVFKNLTRRLSSFYDPVSGEIDFIGGLLPSSSLELLAMANRSHLLSDQTREDCRAAVRDVTRKIRTGALRDPLDSGYFFSRRTPDWSLPSFSKTLESQTRLAATLINVGVSLGDQETVSEGLSLLEMLENDWLGKNLAIVSPGSSEEKPGVFLWDLPTLKTILTEDELNLAVEAFSLSAGGNIPIEVDPQGRFTRLNTLRNQNSPKELATTLQATEDEISKQLETIRTKLLAHRIQNGNLFQEPVLSVTDLAAILKARIARAVVTGQGEDLSSAVQTAESILETHWRKEQGLSRLVFEQEIIPARGKDYAAVSFALSLLYQFTLDDQWLLASKQIIDHAITILTKDSQLLAEVDPSDRIIPLRLHNIAMIFEESTLAQSDLAVSRLFALTGDEKYTNLLEAQFRTLASRSPDSVVSHADFVMSCALGNAHLVAVLRGDPSSPSGKELLKTLNSNLYLPFLTIRPETSSIELTPLPTLPDASGDSSVVLIEDGKVVGRAETIEELSQLLNSAISEGN